ncbi:hypothetical protein [Romboutsia sp.]|uniref:hypothetical protein n=1 Tax=Romboutsia sp. TaxID=1965302 RepID=UPI003F36A700
MKNISKKYLAISILPVLILLYISITPIVTNNIGKEINIKGSIYPNIGGDVSYVNYDINKVAIDRAPEVYSKYATSYEKLGKYLNKTIYVLLKENQGYYEVDYATFDKPSDGVVYLKGKTIYIGYDGEDKYNPIEKAYLAVKYTLDESVNNKQIDKDIEKEYMNDKDKNEVDIDVKIRLYKGYGLVKSITNNTNTQ